MEHHGHACPAPHRIRPRGEGLKPRGREEVGPTTRCSRDICGVGGDARAHLLLHKAGEAHVGEVGTVLGLHVLLPPPWGVFGSRDCPQEDQTQMAVAKSGFLPPHDGIRALHWVVPLCAVAC